LINVSGYPISGFGRMALFPILGADWQRVTLSHLATFDLGTAPDPSANTGPLRQLLLRQEPIKAAGLGRDTRSPAELLLRHWQLNWY
jgi:hypothetical protein